ncbi:MAG: spermidine/putrescine ABC transporter substrate-binding protein [Treponema sp.]|jgi:spermidine/putrescine-binding protein|nr:spermidine/putrescine ABC transporter substrate-binding protein [Treponema sp.]
MKKLGNLGIAIFIFLQTGIFAQNRQLLIYTWEGMFPQEIIDGFTKETGVTVKFEHFGDNEEMLEQLRFTRGGEFDIIISDDYITETAIAEGLVQKLDKSLLTNFNNINPFCQYQFYDPRDEYTVPYGAGVQTIVYDPAKVNFEIRGIADLWDDSLKNRVGITGNPRVINGMVLKTLGKDLNEEDIMDIRAAGKRLIALIPNIRVIKDMGLEDELVSGNISAALMYTDQVMKSKIKKPDLKVVFPREGVGFGIMPAFIPSRAPNAAAAHRFLNYILDPRRGARCFEYMGYYCTFSASEQYIDPKLREFLILPKLGNFEMVWNLSEEAEDEHVRVWQEFTAAQERRR